MKSTDAPGNAPGIWILKGEIMEFTSAEVAANVLADTEKLLAAKDTTISLLHEQITLLQELAEQRRLAYMHQCKELAEHRDLHHYIKKDPFRFALYSLLNDVWPFSLWYHRFDGGRKW